MKISIGNGVIIAATLFLSACMAKREPLPVEDFVTWTGIREQTTLVQLDPESDPVSINVALSNEEDLRRALDGLFPEVAAIDNLGDRIAAIREYEKGRISAGASASDRRFSVLSGLGGVYADAFLDGAAATLDENGNFDGSRRVYKFFYGKIQNYEFNGSVYGGDDSGMFESITYITTVTIPVGDRPILSKTDAFRWIVEVDAGGFTVVPKDPSDPSDPFPGTMKFSDAMLSRIELLGFEFKLWAEGRRINIVSIEHKEDGSSVFVPVPRSDPRYDRTAENCIDMMFVNYPPENYGDQKPPQYCLGRCKNPLLINTDG